MALTMFLKAAKINAMIRPLTKTTESLIVVSE